LSQQLKDLALPLVKEELAGHLRDISPQESQEHDPPGNDGIQGNPPQQDFGGVVLMVEDPASALEHPMPFFDAPAKTIPAKALERLFD